MIEGSTPVCLHARIHSYKIYMPISYWNWISRYILKWFMVYYRFSAAKGHMNYSICERLSMYMHCTMRTAAILVHVAIRRDVLRTWMVLGNGNLLGRMRNRAGYAIIFSLVFPSRKQLNLLYMISNYYYPCFFLSCSNVIIWRLHEYEPFIALFKRIRFISMPWWH